MMPLRSHKTKTKVLFLTKYVCRSSVDFAGPVGERYAGLYFSFMERFRKDYRFFWHSGQDGKTKRRQAGANRTTVRTSSGRMHFTYRMLRAGSDGRIGTSGR